MPSTSQKVDRLGRPYLVAAGSRWTREAPVREVESRGQVYALRGGALEELGDPCARRIRLVRPSDQVLLIVPGLTNWLWGAFSLLVAAGTVAAWCDYVARHRGTAWEVAGLTLGLGFLGLLHAAGAMMLLTDRCRFDRAGGRATRWYWFRTVWDVPLGDVAAVQCLHAGWYRTKAGWRDTYQANLVLHSELCDRVQLYSQGDGPWAGARIRSLAREVAAFLQVPVVDQIDDTWVPQPDLRWWE